MNNSTTTCKTTGMEISVIESNYREGLKNELLKKLQSRFGKTREQVLELFRSYNKNSFPTSALAAS